MVVKVGCQLSILFSEPPWTSPLPKCKIDETLCKYAVLTRKPKWLQYVSNIYKAILVVAAVRFNSNAGGRMTSSVLKISSFWSCETLQHRQSTSPVSFLFSAGKLAIVNVKCRMTLSKSSGGENLHCLEFFYRTLLTHSLTSKSRHIPNSLNPSRISQYYIIT
jgi:hypothetical protein